MPAKRTKREIIQKMASDLNNRFVKNHSAENVIIIAWGHDGAFLSAWSKGGIEATQRLNDDAVEHYGLNKKFGNPTLTTKVPVDASS